MSRKKQAIQEHRIRAAMESEDIWGVKNKQLRERYARKKVLSNNKKTPTKAKKANKGLTQEEALDIWNNYNPKYSELSPEARAEIDKAHKEMLASANNSGNTSSNQANAKTNTGNQTANQPQTNNVSNNTNNTTKGKANTGSKPTTTKGKLWRTGIPFVADIALNSLNSTSPTNNTLLPRESLMDYTRNQDNGAGTALNVMDAILNPADSYYWEDAGDWLGDKWYDIWSGAAGLFSDDKAFVNNVGVTARDIARDAVDWIGAAVDLGTYAVPYLNIAKGAYLTSKAVGNNIWDTARDFEDIKDYSYDNLGFDDYIGDSVWRGIKAGFNNLFSRVGENRDFYQRGRYSLNEMLNAMAKKIENSKDKSSPEYKDLVGKFEKFNNLAKLSDYYWATKKEMDASDLSKEDFLKSKNLTPEAFDAFEQNVNTLHNLGSNLALNESNGIKRSDYTEGTYGYQDFTDAVNTAKRSLEGDSTDIDTDTLNAFMSMGTDVGKVITGKPVENTTGTGTNTGTTNTTNENTQSNLTPDYLTEFYKKFDKTYNYDPAKGRFNIWL